MLSSIRLQPEVLAPFWLQPVGLLGSGSSDVSISAELDRAMEARLFLGDSPIPRRLCAGNFIVLWAAMSDCSVIASARGNCCVSSSASGDSCDLASAKGDFYDMASAMGDCSIYGTARRYCSVWALSRGDCSVFSSVRGDPSVYSAARGDFSVLASARGDCSVLSSARRDFSVLSSSVSLAAQRRAMDACLFLKEPSITRRVCAGNFQGLCAAMVDCFVLTSVTGECSFFGVSEGGIAPFFFIQQRVISPFCLK